MPAMGRELILKELDLLRYTWYSSRAMKSVVLSRRYCSTLPCAAKSHDANLKIMHNVISESEETLILRFLNTILSRKRYEGNHWDDVIQQYKELEMSNYKAPAEVAAAIKGVEKRIESILSKPISFLPPHVIELSQDGWIGPHVDSIKFSGGFVAGLSLQSTRIMALSCGAEAAKSMTSTADSVPTEERVEHLHNGAAHATTYTIDADGFTFQHANSVGTDTSKFVNRLVRRVATDPGAAESRYLPELVEFAVPPRSLYILQGPWRYHYSHAILGRGQVPKLVSALSEEPTRRTSIIFRDVKS